jgi:predicted metal-binding membrane protein
MWTAVGLLLYPLGMAVAGALLAKPALSQAAPWLGGALVALAGVMQFGPRKQRQLSCCQAAPRAFTRQPFTVSGAWRQGWRTGRDCVRCCAGLTVALLVLGVMDLLAMAAVTVAIAAERLTPAKARVAPALGVMLIAAGALLCFETQLTFP